ncbi:MAG: hypothetical protein K6G88_09000 [Lachnospiraceae bacterium]|nr:hypothetical protein [Lachnospiraceae bacterium]
MVEKFRNKLFKRTTALVVVVTLFVVGVIGNNYITDKNTYNADGKEHVELADVNADVLNMEYSKAENSKLKSADEIKVATTNTEMGKISEELQNAYQILISNEDNKEAIIEFNDTVKSLKSKTEIVLADNEYASADEFKIFINDNFEKLEQYSSKLAEESCSDKKSVIKKIGNLVAPEMEVASLSDDLSFNDVTNENINDEQISEEDLEEFALSDTNEADVVDNVSKADIKNTNDTAINEKIKEEFSSYDSVLDIYQYVKNNYQMQFYYGARKGAVGTYEQKSGNDYDIASLLIGILRDRGIPAKYVRGNVRVTAQQAIQWTGAKDALAAAKVMSALGIPCATISGAEGIEYVKMEHVWVLAYVPYTDYRGTGNKSGKELWIPLDASFKKVEFVKDVDVEAINKYVTNDENKIDGNTELNDVNVGELAEYVSEDNSAFVKYMLENGYGEDTFTEAFGGVQIVEEDLGYLPLSSPYAVEDVLEKFDDIPKDLTSSINISLGSISEKLLTTDLYGKRITIAYDAATDEDVALIKKYGGLFKTPAYMIKLKPVLYVDGKNVAEGNAVTAGTTQRYNIGIYEPSDKNNVNNESNIITAGGMYSIAIDYGNIASDEIDGISENVKKLQKYISEENIYTEEIMGELLNGISRAYFSQLDTYNMFVAGQKEVVQTRALSLGIVGFAANGIFSFGRAVELKEGGYFLDISHDVHSVVSLNGNNEDEKAYMLQSGIYASAMEHGVLEQFTGVESVSTIKALQYAQENEIPIHSISKENYSEEIVKLNVSNAVLEDIKSAVNTGKIVIIPEETITINQWSGSGYMVLDPDTCACGYMISGGLSGGAMTFGEMFEEYVSQVLNGIVGMILWEVGTTALLAMCPCGWVAGIQLALNIVQLIMLTAMIVEMISLLVDYARTGDVRYLQELLIQIAAMATLSLVTHFAKDKIDSLKEKVVEEIDRAGLRGACFIAGTFVVAVSDLVPIENVKAGDLVQSFNPGTQNVSEKKVIATIEKQTSELIHISINNEVINATTNHPFYVLDRGFVKAKDLRAGDVLCTVNGDYVTVEWIEHEILEKPVKVYNLSVADNHTYFVGENGVGVHNDSCKGNWNRKISKTEDLNSDSFSNLKDNGTVKVNSSGSDRPLYSDPNSYYSTGNGEHVFIYDGEGKLIYDISPKRVKGFQIDVKPSTKEEFFRPVKLTGEVPTFIKNMFGW